DAAAASDVNLDLHVAVVEEKLLEPAKAERESHGARRLLKAQGRAADAGATRDLDIDDPVPFAPMNRLTRSGVDGAADAAVERRPRAGDDRERDRGESRDCDVGHATARRHPSPRSVPAQERAAHMRKTPTAGASNGALYAAAMPRPRTLRVSAGSMMPSSHRRAVE